jgi:repressor LexA
MSAALTPKQHAVYEFLRDRHRDGEPPPTLDQVCAALGLKSRGSLHKHIQALVEAGLVDPMDRKHRGIRLAEDLAGVPMLGYIAAGRPIEACPVPESMEVPAQLLGKAPCYVLQVRGDSMVGEGILDGDWVVIESRSEARDGEIVVALIDEREATLKRIEQRPGGVVLHPANPSLRPIEYATGRVRVQGVLVGQMRSYR